MQQCLLIKHFNHQLNHSKTTVIRDFETFPTQRGNSSQNETRQNRSNSNDLLHKKFVNRTKINHKTSSESDDDSIEAFYTHRSQIT